jgi:hypothetical protein
MGLLLLLAGWILLRTASGLQPDEGAPPPPVSVLEDPAAQGQAIPFGAPELPREWTWQRPAICFDSFCPKPR